VSGAVLSLGSNLDDRFGYLQGAVAGLAGVLRAVSPVYENPAWGVPDQPAFLNAVVLVEASGVDARGWLDMAQALERAAGRRRTIRWGPRTLDVDVVTVDGVTSTDLELTLPHPGAHQRVSVLLPWHDVDPAAVLPGRGPVARLLSGLDRSAMHRRDDLNLRPPATSPRDVASRVNAAGFREATGSRDAPGFREAMGSRDATGSRDAAGAPEAAGSWDATGSREATGSGPGGAL
jgi:2-amino-4-hydroxy-6-hydroxymethyldihydropteridine diphosphokinase